MIDALIPKTRRTILGLLALHPQRSFYLREIVRAIGGSPGSVQRELRLLTQAGILAEQRRGNQRHYWLNESCPIAPEIRSMILKTVGLVDVLREALAGLDGVRVAFVYGSFAEGEAGPGSDVDLMVVGEVSFTDVSERLWPAQEQLRREVNATVYSPAEFREKVTCGHDFLTEVLGRPKLFVIGDVHVLGELAARGPAEQAGGDATTNS